MIPTLLLFAVFSTACGIYFGITNNNLAELAWGVFLGGLFWFVAMVLIVAELAPAIKSKHRKKKIKSV
jgi:peptidoglycan biosynthesis protein MviN/MurJ (putative lipid II flippase)